MKKTRIMATHPSWMLAQQQRAGARHHLWISGAEEKTEETPLKMLGGASDGGPKSSAEGTT